MRAIANVDRLERLVKLPLNTKFNYIRYDVSIYKYDAFSSNSVKLYIEALGILLYISFLFLIMNYVMYFLLLKNFAYIAFYYGFQLGPFCP